MSDTTQRDPSRLAYGTTMGMLALALAFPIGLMVFNPTLMFERGWEQYVGTGIYLFAVVSLARELLKLRRDEAAFAEADEWLAHPDEIASRDRRVLPTRVRQIASPARMGNPATMGQLVELNREASALDQEQAAGRFVLPKYILYLLPVIGFIGTVEGISHALMNISRVLPLVKELDEFLSNLTTVTSALQVAFDSTLLALFLSAALMLVQTLVYRRAEELLARIDRWVVEHALPHFARAEVVKVEGQSVEQVRRELAEFAATTVKALEAMAARMGEGLGPHVAQFATAVDKLPGPMAAIERGAEAIGRAGEDLSELSGLVDELDDIARRGLASLSRIEASIEAQNQPDDQLDLIRRAVERSCQATEALAGQWASAYEKSSRATQEQLGRTLNSLKDALEMLNVSMEQGNALYRNIVKKMLPTYPTVSAMDDRAA